MGTSNRRDGPDGLSAQTSLGGKQVLKHVQSSEEWNEKSLGAKGFTLIELLVVIVILGILAAVVVFAVGGITDRGKASACKTDRRTLLTAGEAYIAQADPAVGSGDKDATDLKAAGFLSEISDLYTVKVAAPQAGPPYVPAKVTVTKINGNPNNCT